MINNNSIAILEIQDTCSASTVSIFANGNLIQIMDVRKRNGPLLTWFEKSRIFSYSTAISHAISQRILNSSIHQDIKLEQLLSMAPGTG